MNNEPVAVVDHRQQNGVTWLKIEKGRSMMPSHNTLLYTHPADRIAELEQALENIIAISDRKHDAWDKAKELLKKASEK